MTFSEYAIKWERGSAMSDFQHGQAESERRQAELDGLPPDVHYGSGNPDADLSHMLTDEYQQQLELRVERRFEELEQAAQVAALDDFISNFDDFLKGLHG